MVRAAMPAAAADNKKPTKMVFENFEPSKVDKSEKTRKAPLSDTSAERPTSKKAKTSVEKEGKQ
eukprot:680437-Prorocentrum_minimum.AAC.1